MSDNSCFFAAVHNYGSSGMCGQLISFLNGIQICINNNIKYLIVDTFLNEIHKKDELTTVANLFDLEEFNPWLEEHTGVTVLDYKTHHEIIPKECQPYFTWIQLVTYKDFFICPRIAPFFKFQKRFYDKANSFINTLPKDKKINCIHLRFEDDVKHWANINKMPIEDFLVKLADLYIKIIEQHFSKDEHIIILGYNTDNYVTKWLDKNNYSFSFIPKDLSWGREINAIVDLIIANTCNNVFLSTYSHKFSRGSNFSYMVFCRLPKEVKKICISLDNLKEEIEIYQN